jgi:hypothetical protein
VDFDYGKIFMQVSLKRERKEERKKERKNDFGLVTINIAFSVI